MASIGTIVTRVYTSRAQLPVPGATVAVTQRAGGGRHTLLALRVTVPGYEMLLVENVQVFPNTETLQELELIPLPEQTSSSTRGEIVDIPPQDL